jgi:hypothetical protein
MFWQYGIYWLVDDENDDDDERGCSRGSLPRLYHNVGRNNQLTGIVLEWVGEGRAPA